MCWRDSDRGQGWGCQRRTRRRGRRASARVVQRFRWYSVVCAEEEDARVIGAAFCNVGCAETPAPVGTIRDRGVSCHIEKQLHAVWVREIGIRAAFAPPYLVGVVPTEAIGHARVPDGAAHGHDPIGGVAWLIRAVCCNRVLSITVEAVWFIARL